MAKTLFITATNTNVGKTYSSLQIIKQLSNMGLSVCAYKPIETGVENIPLDGNLLHQEIIKNQKFKSLTINDIVTYQFLIPAAPFVAKQNRSIDLNKIKEDYQRLKNSCDILIVEGAGGLLVPIERNFFMIDLIEFLEIDKTLLITSSKLGSINDTLLSIEALKNKNIDFNWCVNLYEDKDDFDKITKPFYDEYFKKFYILQDNLLELLKDYDILN
jgi:dethiobiotin synthetase